MGKSSKGKTVNQERAATPQEMRLWEEQTRQMGAATQVAKEQEARSKEQHQIWKDNYLVDEVMGDVDPNGAEAQKYAEAMNAQMPRYAEDTSGTYDQAPQPQQPQPKSGGGKGGTKGGRRG